MNFLIKQRPEANNFRVQCFMKSNKAGFEEEKEEEKERIEGKSLDEIIQEILKNLNIFIQKSAIAGVILGLLMTYNPHLAALAASGGRMGGRSFSSSSLGGSSSSSSSSRSYSSGSSSKSSSSRSSSSSSSYSSGSSSSSSSRSSSSSSSPSYSSGSSSSNKSSSTSSSSTYVALLGATRSLQKDLDKIAEVADTSTRSRLSYILQESTAALLRHLAYCYSSYSSVMEIEKLFKMLTIEERAKFDEDTLVNVDNIKKQSTPSRKPNGLSNDYIVITILVAAKGEHKLSVVNNSDKLKEALQKLGFIPTSKILGVEVMWTPQEENDTLTEREMLEDYPRLRPL
ncbi:hypothetical protein MKX01_029677 [Papaver californicum]|nr:hypothetical protein MKX01_020731 [Papaver californicum]KAI3966731.1 hypothetical protein MKX01_029677 [Papaver californicum]